MKIKSIISLAALFFPASVMALWITEHGTYPRAIEQYDSCDFEQCLFKDNDGNLVGTGTIEGYATSYITGTFDRGDIVCNAFTITSGSPRVVNRWIERVESGNTLARKNDNGDVIVNVDYQYLSDAEREIINSSSKEKAVKMVVFLPFLPRKGAPRCAPLSQAVTLLE